MFEQSYTPEETLDGAAQQLRRALAKEAAGTSARFVPITLPAAEGVLTAHQLNQPP